LARHPHRNGYSYLPESWTENPARRRAARIPDSVQSGPSRNSLVTVRRAIAIVLLFETGASLVTREIHHKLPDEQRICQKCDVRSRN
jgi:hypothetical protein